MNQSFLKKIYFIVVAVLMLFTMNASFSLADTIYPVRVVGSDGSIEVTTPIIKDWDVGTGSINFSWYYAVDNPSTAAMKTTIYAYGPSNTSNYSVPGSYEFELHDSIPANTIRVYIYDCFTASRGSGARYPDGVNRFDTASPQSREIAVLGFVDFNSDYYHKYHKIPSSIIKDYDAIACFSMKVYRTCDSNSKWNSIGGHYLSFKPSFEKDGTISESTLFADGWTNQTNHSNAVIKNIKCSKYLNSVLANIKDKGTKSPYVNGEICKLSETDIIVKGSYGWKKEYYKKPTAEELIHAYFVKNGLSNEFNTYYWFSTGMTDGRNHVGSTPNTRFCVKDNVITPDYGKYFGEYATFNYSYVKIQDSCTDKTDRWFLTSKHICPDGSGVVDYSSTDESKSVYYKLGNRDSSGTFGNSSPNGKATTNYYEGIVRIAAVLNQNGKLSSLGIKDITNIKGTEAKNYTCQYKASAIRSCQGYYVINGLGDAVPDSIPSKLTAGTTASVAIQKKNAYKTIYFIFEDGGSIEVHDVYMVGDKTISDTLRESTTHLGSGTYKYAPLSKINAGYSYTKYSLTYTNEKGAESKTEGKAAKTVSVQLTDSKFNAKLCFIYEADLPELKYKVHLVDKEFKDIVTPQKDYTTALNSNFSGSFIKFLDYVDNHKSDKTLDKSLYSIRDLLLQNSKNLSEEEIVKLLANLASTAKFNYDSLLGKNLYTMFSTTSGKTLTFAQALNIYLTYSANDIAKAKSTITYAGKEYKYDEANQIIRYKNSANKYTSTIGKANLIKSGNTLTVDVYVVYVNGYIVQAEVVDTEGNTLANSDLFEVTSGTDFTLVNPLSGDEILKDVGTLEGFSSGDNAYEYKQTYVKNKEDSTTRTDAINNYKLENITESQTVIFEYNIKIPHTITVHVIDDKENELTTPVVYERIKYGASQKVTNPYTGEYTYNTTTYNDADYNAPYEIVIPDVKEDIDVYFKYFGPHEVNVIAIDGETGEVLESGETRTIQYNCSGNFDNPFIYKGLVIDALIVNIGDKEYSYTKTLIGAAERKDSKACLVENVKTDLTIKFVYKEGKEPTIVTESENYSGNVEFYLDQQNCELTKFSSMRFGKCDEGDSLDERGTDEITIKFPFDIIYNGSIQKANNAISVDSSDFSFDIPVWNEEKEYSAITANSIVESYDSSTNTITVTTYNYSWIPTIKGNIYDLAVTNVLGDSTWKNSLFGGDNQAIEYKIDTLPVGQSSTTANGITNKVTTTVLNKMEDETITTQTKGYSYGIALGSRILFSLNTKGQKTEYIKIEPKITYIDKAGKVVDNVKFLYKEEGITKDFSLYNSKVVTTTLTNGRSVVDTTAEIYKASLVNATKQRNIGTFGALTLNSKDTSTMDSVRLEYVNYIKQEATALYGESLVASSEFNEAYKYNFHWYGEYKLPSTFYVVDSSNNKLSDGFVMVSFKINGYAESDSANPYISYSNNTENINASSYEFNGTEFEPFDANSIINLPNAKSTINKTIYSEDVKDIINNDYYPIAIYDVAKISNEIEINQ